MSIRANLIAARALIADIDHWHQDDYAVDEFGAIVKPTDPTAKCFCALGAVAKARGADTMITEERTYLNFAAEQLHGPFMGVVSVNDDIGHAATIQVFDKAIEIAPN